MTDITEEAGPQEQSPLLLIGRRERLDFPDWGLRRVRAKIDTGAFSSALDVTGYQIVETATGMEVELHLVPKGRRRDQVRIVRTPLVRMTTVRSSSGSVERRPVIEPLVRLGPITRRIRLTVTDRSRMKCRMLLGRQALAGVFLVDVQSKDLLHPARKAKRETTSE